jgi:predicted enzyme related to lactoylglutathione lyase
MGLKIKSSRKKPGWQSPRCYSLAFYTRHWKEIRDFYVDTLGGRVISEREQRYCDLAFGSVPLSFRAAQDDDRAFECHFHLYLACEDRETLLERVRTSGVIVRMEGPYASFFDPEGRIIKVTSAVAVLE